MRRVVSAVALALAFAPAVPAAYSNLIATSDGNSVYFQIPSGFPNGSAGQSSFVARYTDSGLVVQEITTTSFAQPAPANVQDVSADGSVIASAWFSTVVCHGYGEFCAPYGTCDAGFAITGPELNTGGDRYQTFIRLDRAGTLAWIEQGDYCGGIGVPRSIYGLFAIGASSLAQVTRPASGRAANAEHGRRVITDRGQVLILSGSQLQWVDVNGSHPLRQVAGAYEAVTDAAGNNVVYVDGPVGELHWIDGLDEDLGLTGSAPALSDDGNTLAFLSPDQSLQIYDRVSRNVYRLGSDEFLEFSLGGRSVFGVTTDGRLVRIDLDTGISSDWLPPFAYIQSVDAPPGSLNYRCKVCYGDVDPGLILGRGMILRLRGVNLDFPGLRARIGKVEIPLTPTSPFNAWLQVPSDLPEKGPLDVYSPDFAMLFRRSVASVQDRVLACFTTLHEDFGRAVSKRDPATPGEIVHVFLTGLHGVEPVLDGVPNPTDHEIPVADPPSLADPGFADVTYFGLAWGFVGIQQLDLRVHSQSSNNSLFSGVDAFGCTPPPVGP
jgi:uncharacterized protein (TIGR03437 family)